MGKKGEGGARMSENLIYADLNLTESTRPRLQKITDVQGSTYAEVKVQSLDTNAAASYTSSDPTCHTDTINFKDSRRGKSCCSRTSVALLVAVITLLLILAVCLILIYRPTASRPPDSKTFFTTYEETLGCPPSWEKKGEKCYFFSKIQEIKDWNASRKECTDMDSDLVIIDSEEELNYLVSKSRGHYYLLGFKYSMNEKKWKWINNVEHHSAVNFTIKGHPNYYCAVIGHGNVETASCGGSSTTENMCEKAANISEKQTES